jgi:integrase
MPLSSWVARPSECCTLTWDDVNSANKTVNINKALDIDGTLKKPKNDTFRDVDLTQKALDVLESQKSHTRNKKHGLIFVNNLTKNRWDMTKFLRRIWYPALKKLEMQRRTLYNIRHTFGSVLISTPGINIKYISEQMGHANTTTTEKHYARWMKTSNAAILAIRNAA